MNAIYSTEETFCHIKNSVSNAFPDSKFVLTTVRTEDIADLNEQLRIVSEINNGANRNAMNNYSEAQRIYFWPKMKQDFLKYMRNIPNTKI